jgi:hypothetical protein
MIKDFKNRQYAILDFTNTHTFLQCAKTGAVVIVANHRMKEMGFIV